MQANPEYIKKLFESGAISESKYKSLMVDAALARFRAENTPRANLIFAIKYMGGALLISAALLYGMGELLLRNQEAIDRLGKFMGW